MFLKYSSLSAVKLDILNMFYLWLDAWSSNDTNDIETPGCVQMTVVDVMIYSFYQVALFDVANS